jgi:hypothetical protein
VINTSPVSIKPGEDQGALLAVCSCYPDEVEQYLGKLPATHKLRKTRSQDWVLADLIQVAAALDWLPARTSPRARRKIGDWVHLVRELRNLAHPGKHIRDYPGVRVGRAHWSDALTAFTIAHDALLATVNESLRQKMIHQGI